MVVVMMVEVVRVGLMMMTVVLIMVVMVRVVVQGSNPPAGTSLDLAATSGGALRQVKLFSTHAWLYLSLNLSFLMQRC